MKINSDVSFDEDTTISKSRNWQLQETYEEVVAPRAPELMKEVTRSFYDDILEEHDILEPHEPPNMDISHKRNLAWAREIIQETKRYDDLEGS